MKFANTRSRFMQFSWPDVFNLVITAGLSALIVFVGNLANLLPSIADEGGVPALIITGVIGPALVALKDFLTDYANNRS